MEENPIAEIATRIDTLARQVAEAHADHEIAKAEINAADAALIERLVAIVTPALPALTSRVQIDETPDGGETFAAWRGVYLNFTNLSVGPGLSSDRYRGVDLFLTEYGTFIELTYTGRTATGWTSSTRLPNFAEVGAEYDGEDVAKALLKALEAAAAGNLTKRAEQLRTKAARIQAIVALLTGK